MSSVFKPSDNLEFEVGKESSVLLESNDGDGHHTDKPTDVVVSTAQSSHATAGDGAPELMEPLQNLTLTQEKNNAKTAPVSKLELETTRIQIGAEIQLARKAIWKEKTQKEIERRALQRRALDSLPVERVTTVKGRASMSNMFVSWRELLKDKRTSFLFHAVFPILHGEGCLVTNDILGCRKTSHEWKKSVETHIQSWFKLSELSVGGISSLPVLQIYFPGSAVEELELFNSILNTVYKGQNPFISRKLAVELRSEFMSHGLTQIIQLLLRWGREIWQLVIILTELEGFDAYYEEICFILSLTPNLRAFCVSTIADVEEPKPTASDSKINEQLLIWALRIQRTLLPPLPHLSLLSLASPYMPILIVHALLNKCGSTLTTVEVGGFGRKLSSFINGTRLPHLREFYYLSYHTPAVDDSKLSVAWPALQKFKIFHDGDLALKPVDIQTLFKSLNFGVNLRHLTFALLNPKGQFVQMDQGEIKTLSLDLPRLETLDFVVCNVNLDSIDFILPLKSLKLLELCYFKYVSGFECRQQFEADEPDPSKCGSTSAHEIIHFSNYVDRLYDSNIWELLPELKHVTIKVVDRAQATGEMRSTGRQYSRDGYRQHCNLLLL